MSILHLLTEYTLSLVQQGGLWGIGLVSFLENVFTPIPSEAVIPFAGILVQQGKLDLVMVILAATAGSVLGAYVFYGIGYALGSDRTRAFLLRHQRYLRISSNDLDRAENWFQKYDRWAVLVARVVPLVRSFISIPAGYVRMPLAEFTILTMIGTAVWSAFLVYLGIAFGHAYEQIVPYFRILDVVVGVAFLLLAAYYFYRRRS